MVITHASVAAAHIPSSVEQINNLVVPGTAVNKGTALLTVNHTTSLPPKFVPFLDKTEAVNLSKT